jgi:ribosome biogenesis GTPase
LFPHAFARLVAPPLVLARVESQERDAYVLVISARDASTHAFTDASTEARSERRVSGRLGGALRHAAADATTLPAVGDYVAVELVAGESLALVRALLPRRNLFARRIAGGGSALQPIAANIDTLFVAVACNRDFNLRRIERYLAGAEACGVDAAIALTKADLADDPAEFVTAARSVANGRRVFAVRALEGVGLDVFDGFRGPERTLAFVGSSGAGKSTLVNALLGEHRLDTGSAREDDDRGRHTTTRRQLVRLPDGTAIVDTPGMREFGLGAGEAAVDAAFDDVATLAAACRFRDCRHQREPGCAVLGELDAERLSSWRKLTREALFEAGKTDHAVRQAEKRRWKSITKSARAFDKRRGD